VRGHALVVVVTRVPRHLHLQQRAGGRRQRSHMRQPCAVHARQHGGRRDCLQLGPASVRKRLQLEVTSPKDPTSALPTSSCSLRSGAIPCGASEALCTSTARCTPAEAAADAATSIASCTCDVRAMQTFEGFSWVHSRACNQCRGNTAATDVRQSRAVHLGRNSA